MVWTEIPLGGKVGRDGSHEPHHGMLAQRVDSIRVPGQDARQRGGGKNHTAGLFATGAHGADRRHGPEHDTVEGRAN